MRVLGSHAFGGKWRRCVRYIFASALQAQKTTYPPKSIVNKNAGEGKMIQLSDCRPTPVTMTNVAAITILLTSYFGFSGIGQATEVRHPETQHDTGDDLRPTGRGWGEHDPSGRQHELANKFSRTNNGILYHGGPLIIPPPWPN